MSLIPLADGHRETADLGFERGRFRPLEGFRRFAKPPHRFRLSFAVAESDVAAFEAAIADAWGPAGLSLELASLATEQADSDGAERSVHELRFIGPLEESRQPNLRRYSVEAEIVAGGAGRLVPSDASDFASVIYVGDDDPDVILIGDDAPDLIVIGV